MAGEELVSKYQTLIFLAGSASAEFFADIALSPFEAVKVCVGAAAAGGGGGHHPPAAAQPSLHAHAAVAAAAAATTHLHPTLVV